MIAHSQSADWLAKLISVPRNVSHRPLRFVTYRQRPQPAKPPRVCCDKIIVKSAINGWKILIFWAEKLRAQTRPRPLPREESVSNWEKDDHTFEQLSAQGFKNYHLVMNHLPSDSWLIEKRDGSEQKPQKLGLRCVKWSIQFVLVSEVSGRERTGRPALYVNVTAFVCTAYYYQRVKKHNSYSVLKISFHANRWKVTLCGL